MMAQEMLPVKALQCCNIKARGLRVQIQSRESTMQFAGAA